MSEHYIPVSLVHLSKVDIASVHAYADGHCAPLIEQRDALLEALELIAGTDAVDAMLDPQRAVRVAQAAIAKVRG